MRKNTVLAHRTPLFLNPPQQNLIGLAGDGSVDLDGVERSPWTPEMDADVSPAADFWPNFQVCGRENCILTHLIPLFAQSFTA